MVFKQFALFGFEGTNLQHGKSGDYIAKVTPVPISNTVVKLCRADGTWWEAAWESRTSPVFSFFGVFGVLVSVFRYFGDYVLKSKAFF